MVDAKEKDEARKSNLSSEKDAAESVIAPSTILSKTTMNFEKTVVGPGITDNMEEEEEGEEEEEEDVEDEEEEGEEEEEEEEEEEGEEQENDGKKAMVAVNSEELNTNEEHNKGKSMVEEETNEENAVKEDAIKGKDMGKTEELKTEEPKNGEESDKRKGKRPRKKNKTKAAQKTPGMVAVDKPESSGKKKGSKRVESMGMVFMCSSKTKTDCFRYKVLGLPASKKDQVAKIYKGMRLFLFDVDLRLMYGIFKAAGPGGFNVEPKAFKSEFPSQVRFTVLEDCLPLAEEKFKEVIKENYYTRNKFEGQLNAVQVKKLCKLFVVTGKGVPRPKIGVKSRRTRAVENHRIRPDRGHRSRPEDAYASRDQRKRKRRAQVEERRSRSPLGREKRRYHEHEYERAPVLYEREPPVPRYLPLPPPAPASPVRSYGYERPLETHHYVLDHVPEPRTYRVLEIEPRHHDEILSREHDRDPYRVYSREDPSYYGLAPEYHLVSREYPPPRAIEPPEYRLSGGSRVASYRDVGHDYRSSAASLPEYRHHRTHYRY